METTSNFNVKRSLGLAVLAGSALFGLATAQANADTYTVKSGDTLSSIALTHRTTIDQLKQANNKASDLIFAGDVLNYNGTADTQTDYTVVAGDTLSKIADDHGLSLAELLALNDNLSVDTVLHVGDKLTVAGTPKVTVQPAVVQTPVVTPTQTAVTTPVVQAVDNTQTATTPAVTQPATAEPAQVSTMANSGSTYDQFIANGGTDALWNNVVMPESGGNPNAVSPNGYMGLGQTKESWGTGDVATQTRGLVNYATSRYGSVENAVNYRLSNGWW